MAVAGHLQHLLGLLAIGIAASPGEGAANALTKRAARHGDPELSTYGVVVRPVSIVEGLAVRASLKAALVIVFTVVHRGQEQLHRFVSTRVRFQPRASLCSKSKAGYSLIVFWGWRSGRGAVGVGGRGWLLFFQRALFRRVFLCSEIRQG